MSAIDTARIDRALKRFVRNYSDENHPHYCVRDLALDGAIEMELLNKAEISELGRRIDALELEVFEARL